MSQKQRTLKQSIQISGVGLHSGKEVSLQIHPAEVDYWYKFRRTDIENSPLIEVLAENVCDVSRGTTLEKEGVKVATVEHVVSALVGMGIDNALIEVNDMEMPILDGSAGDIVREIEKTGIVEQEKDRRYYDLKNEVFYEDQEKGIYISFRSAPETDYTVLIDYDSSVVTPQFAHFNPSKHNFASDIAPSRTFVFLHELEHLFTHNLIKGGNLSNAIVFANSVPPQSELNRLADLLGRPRVEVTESGILNNLSLHQKNEPARHKLMDLIGDLALVGYPVRGQIVAHRPGHAINVNFAKLIRQQIQKQIQGESLPPLDLIGKPLYDINDIKKLIPHRSPFLLIDKILYMDDEQVIGVKNATMNEPFFVGHFPEKPVMPGVLLIEALAQTGGIYVLSRVPDPENYLTFFLKIDKVKFRQQVVPGDTVILRMQLLEPIRRGLCNMKGRAYVGDNIVMEAELLAQVRCNDKSCKYCRAVIRCT